MIIYVDNNHDIDDNEDVDQDNDDRSLHCFNFNCNTPVEDILFSELSLDLCPVEDTMSDRVPSTEVASRFV